MFLLHEEPERRDLSLETVSAILAGKIEELFEKDGGVLENTLENRRLAELLKYRMPDDIIGKISAKLDSEGKKLLNELLALSTRLAKKRVEDIFENIVRVTSPENFRTLDFVARKDPQVIIQAIINIAEKTNNKA